MTSQFLEAKKRLPYLGTGLGLRRELTTDILAHTESIDWLEFVPENYMGLGGAARQRLQMAQSSFPLVSHGINLSLGSTDDLSVDYLKALKQLLNDVDAPWWSDHLCFSSLNGAYLHDLLPIPFSKEAIAHVSARIRKAHEFVERPMLIENISAYMIVPGSEMTEAQFLSEVLEKADCGLLLDVNNVYVNSINHGFDPYEYIDQIPVERAVQVHVAGHSLSSGTVIDTHGAPVIEPVFELLDYALRRTDVHAVMLERDQNFPEFSQLLAELDRIRNVVAVASPCLGAAAGVRNERSSGHVASSHRQRKELCV